MFRSLLAVLLLVSSVLATALEKRQWTESKYCNPTTGLCYLQIVPRGTNPIYRIAIPDNASGTFDTVLEIISPISLGWAGFAWGGSMTANPLTVAWPNGQKVTVSSRWSTNRVLPTVYNQATYKTLRSSRNDTHWSVEVACTGCSRWSGGQINTSGLAMFAWAMSRSQVSQPASTSSNFPYHNSVGTFTEPLTSAKNPASAFATYIRNTSG
ncbi:cellobiose dehydrogenase [Podospora aff. communis PSN243]|uniref:Cellobiose dehydrogenase n=1 Tax=Podospora aff. communis PSN243 TaxID=3040156 RepID=A0AAV9GAK2_9PEZI|nr:cellobiose dehydrogenase [Podospora aff. communis PSN243]